VNQVEVNKVMALDRKGKKAQFSKEGIGVIL